MFNFIKKTDWTITISTFAFFTFIYFLFTVCYLIVFFNVEFFTDIFNGGFLMSCAMLLGMISVISICVPLRNKYARKEKFHQAKAFKWFIVFISTASISLSLFNVIVDSRILRSSRNYYMTESEKDDLVEIIHKEDPDFDTSIIRRSLDALYDEERPRWFFIEDPKEFFKIAFPYENTNTKSSVKINGVEHEVKELLTKSGDSIQDPNLVYSLACFTLLKSDVKTTLTNVSNEYLKEFLLKRDAKLIFDEKFQTKGAKGREVHFKSSESIYTTISKFYYQNNRIYIVSVTTTDTSSSNKKMDLFFESFKIK